MNRVIRLMHQAKLQAQFSWPIYNGRQTDAGVRSAQALAVAAKDTLSEVELMARERVRLSYTDWASAKTRAEIASVQRTRGEKLVAGYQQQFRMARRSLLDLLNIQGEFASYQQNAALAQYDVKLAEYRISAALARAASWGLRPASAAASSSSRWRGWGGGRGRSNSASCRSRRRCTGPTVRANRSWWACFWRARARWAASSAAARSAASRAWRCMVSRSVPRSARLATVRLAGRVAGRRRRGPLRVVGIPTHGPRPAQALHTRARRQALQRAQLPATSA